MVYIYYNHLRLKKEKKKKKEMVAVEIKLLSHTSALEDVLNFNLFSFRGQKVIMINIRNTIHEYIGGLQVFFNLIYA